MEGPISQLLRKDSLLDKPFLTLRDQYHSPEWDSNQVFRRQLCLNIVDDLKPRPVGLVHFNEVNMNSSYCSSEIYNNIYSNSPCWLSQRILQINTILKNHVTSSNCNFLIFCVFTTSSNCHFILKLSLHHQYLKLFFNFWINSICRHVFNESKSSRKKNWQNQHT